jgi:hypothetical protein
MTGEPRNEQYAPWPVELEEAIACLRSRPGERYELHLYERDTEDQGRGRAGGLTFLVFVTHKNTYPPYAERTTLFLFPVPPTTWNEQSWKRWVLDRLVDIDLHERMEYTWFGDEHTFEPLHGPGDNPHIIYMASTDLQRRTQFTGKVKPE